MNLRGKIPDTFFEYERKSDILPENGFFLDTHSHSTASDDGWLTPEQCIKWHVANGFNAFVLTDHNTGKNNEEILKFQDKYPHMFIIPGYEWTTLRVHLNFLGIMDFPHKVSWTPSDEDIQFAIREAKKLGAIVQVDHITWTKYQKVQREGKYSHPSRKELLDWGVDGFEINNEVRWYDPRTIHWLESLKKENQLPRPIFLAAGTDIHNPIKEWVTGWTEILFTENERKNISWESVKKALLEARTAVWADHDYYEPHESKEMEKWKISKRAIKKK